MKNTPMGPPLEAEFFPEVPNAFRVTQYPSQYTPEGCRTVQPANGTAPFVSVKQNFNLINMVREYGPARLEEIAKEVADHSRAMLALGAESRTLQDMLDALPTQGTK